MKNLSARYTRAIVRWRWPVIVLAILSTLGAGLGMSRITFATDYRVFFGEDNPELQAFLALQNTYADADSVLYVLEPRSGKVFEPATLAAVAELTEKAWQLPYSSRVDSVTNFQHSRAEGDDLVVEDLIPQPNAPQAILDRAREIALAEPLLRPRLIGPDAAVTAVNVNLRLPGKSGDEVPQLMSAARELAAEVEAAHPAVRVHITGLAPLNNAFDEASRKDMSTLVPLMYAVLLVAVFLLVRSLGASLVTLGVIGLSLIGAMGVTGWLGIALTPPSAIGPTIIMTLAIADSVHILVSLFQEMRAGTPRREALVEAMRINMGPVFLTSLTTVIGFLSLNLSDSPPFHDLGNITAIGVTLAWLFSVTFLPALVAVLPLRAPAKPMPGAGLMSGLGEAVVRHRRGLFWGSIAVSAALIAFIPRIELDDRFVEYFDESVPFRAATDFTAEHLTGLDLIEYSLPSTGAGGINEPEYLRALDAFAQWLRAQPEVAHVNSISDTMKRLNKNMHGDDPAWYRVPDERQLAAQYLLLFEMSVPFGLDLNNQINVDKSATRFTVTLNKLSSAEIRGFEERASQWLADNAPAYMTVRGSGGSVMFANISKRNIESMLGGTLLALVLISAVLMLALRDWRLGLLSLIPNLLPAAMTFGLWGLLVGQVGLAVSTVAAISLGIVVDDTIHFLSKYQRARREKGVSAADAVRYAFSTVGLALTVTTVVLIAGFLVLALSDFQVNSDMALLTAITLTVALLVDFFFLPPLLIKLEENNDVAQEKLAAAA